MVDEQHDRVIGVDHGLDGLIHMVPFALFLVWFLMVMLQQKLSLSTGLGS